MGSYGKFDMRMGVMVALLVFFTSPVMGKGAGITSIQQTQALEPNAIKIIMTKVADWQLAHPSRHPTTDWTHGALFSGMTAWAGMADNDRYYEVLKAFGEKNRWQLGPRPYHADDHCVGQMYLALYEKVKDPNMIKALTERFDWIMANPSDVTLEASKQQRKDRWWWCDALFMGPPVWAKAAVVKGQAKYLDFMNREWWATTDYLYDKEEHLYFRDSTYFNRREANGKKVFWSRGNGWVFAGLVRVLDAMPGDYPDRPRYIQLYKEMAAKLITVQQDDGLWRSSLLDSNAYPAPETSGTGFYCYGLAWGVNRGLLDAATYRPAIAKAWKGLVGCVHPDGMLGSVQPIGAAPDKVSPDLTEIYGVGAFLLAGSEVYKMALGHQVASEYHLLTDS